MPTRARHSRGPVRNAMTGSHGTDTPSRSRSMLEWISRRTTSPGVGARMRVVTARAVWGSCADGAIETSKAIETASPGSAGDIGAPEAERLLPCADRLRTKLCGGHGQLQHHSRLQLVGIRQHVFVRVEDIHVEVAVAQVFLRDLAQRVTWFDRVALRCRR